MSDHFNGPAFSTWHPNGSISLAVPPLPPRYGCLREAAAPAALLWPLGGRRSRGAALAFGRAPLPRRCFGFWEGAAPAALLLAFGRAPLPRRCFGFEIKSGRAGARPSQRPMLDPLEGAAPAALLFLRNKKRPRRSTALQEQDQERPRRSSALQEQDQVRPRGMCAIGRAPLPRRCLGFWEGAAPAALLWHHQLMSAQARDKLDRLEVVQIDCAAMFSTQEMFMGFESVGLPIEPGDQFAASSREPRSDRCSCMRPRRLDHAQSVAASGALAL